MTLEAAIQENTAAVRELAAVMKNLGRPGLVAHPEPEKVKAEAKAPQAQAPGAISYEKDVKPLALKLVAKNKPKYLEIVASYGVKGGPDVPADKLAQFKADIEAALK